MSFIDNFLSVISPQAATAPAQNKETPSAAQVAPNSTPKISREELQAIFTSPEVTGAIKQASKDGMKEGYLELMQKFMAKLLPLFTSMFSSESAKDPKAAFDNLMGGLMSTINEMTGVNKATVSENPQTVLEAKPSAESSQAADMMKMFQQALSQAAPAN